MSAQQIVDAIETTQDYEPPPEATQPKQKSQATQLVELAASAALFHTPDGTGIATVSVDNHKEHHRIRSRGFRDWLKRRFFSDQQRVPASQALQDAIDMLDGKACFAGAERKTWTRVAEQGGRLYLDLCDTRWRAIEIDATGWRIASKPPVAFLRHPGMLALPEPQPGGTLDALWRLMNLPGKDERLLVAAWLVAALRPRGPYPLLIFQGEQGTAKTTQERLLRALIDPHTVELRTLPRDERDLVIGATRNHIIALDNLSGLSVWLSDALCRLATGAGFATRQLYTDDDEIILSVCRPALLNGIDDIARRQDLIDRAIIINLSPLPEEKRRTETDLWREFEQNQPKILGTLLDAASDALRRLPSVRLAKLPRMADFALWATAAEHALGAEADAFMAAYDIARAHAIEAGLEGSPVYATLQALGTARDHQPWSGTATELLAVLRDYLGRETPPRSWPRSAFALGSQLRRLATALRQQGIHIAFTRESGQRQVHIDWVGIAPSSPSLPSCDTANTNKNNGLANDSNDGTMTANDGTMTANDGAMTADKAATPPQKHQSNQQVASHHDADDGNDGDLRLSSMWEAPL